MKTYPVRQIAAALFCFGAVNFALAVDSIDSVVTAVFSRSFNNYQRPTRSNGSDQPLTYVIANGGVEPGMSADQSMDAVKFPGIVRVVGKYLAKQAYFPAKDPKKADLMLVVHWGKTIPANDGSSRILQINGLQGLELSQTLKMGKLGRTSILSVRDSAGSGGSGNSGVPVFAATASTTQANEAAITEAAGEEMVQGLTEIRFAQDQRIEANRHNANLLGYTAELVRRDNPSLYAGAGTAYDELMEDIESERYYVSVTAYDFQEALQHKNNKGLWRTVASIDARGNRFDERLMAMVEQASRYFGRDSGRLVRQFEYRPHIDLGELKTLGVLEQSPSGKR
jgi:hypothetical protein